LWPSFSNGYGRIPQSRTKEGSATHQKAKQKKTWVDVAASLMNGLTVGGWVDDKDVRVVRGGSWLNGQAIRPFMAESGHNLE
jgi:hypothetical protein